MVTNQTGLCYNTKSITRLFRNFNKKDSRSWAAFKINTTISAIPTKKIITFHKKDTVRQIVQRMFDNKTRKLVLEDTSSFINDRIIIEKLTRKFNCLRGEEDFLGMNSDIFSLEQAKNVADNLTISEACKIM